MWHLISHRSDWEKMNNSGTPIPSKEHDRERVLKTALNILAFAEITESGLRRKLTDKGYTADDTEFAVAYMVKHRYLDEKRYLFRLVEYLGNTKLYGKRRITMQVKQKGFSQKTLSMWLNEALDCVSDVENCKKVLPKVKKDTDKKTVEALLRRGFVYGDIKTAMQSDFDDDFA